MDINTSALLTPIVMNEHSVKNRLAIAPMTRISATADGRASETMARYYERFTQGGFGAVSTEGIYIDQAFSQDYAYQPGMTDDTQAQAWKPVVAGIKTHGALAIAQLMHADALSQGNRFRHGTLGPSAIQPKGEQMVFYHGNDRYAVPNAMTEVGKTQVAVEVSSVIRASADSFRVAWTERRYIDDALAATERWSAILTIVVQPPTDADRLKKNPVGVYVHGLNWSKKLG